MNIKILVALFFSLTSLTACADEEINWNKKCASDIGLTSKQAVDKYNSNRLLYRVSKGHYIRQYSLEEVLKEKKLVEKSINNKCIFYSTIYSSRKDQNLNYHKSKILNFNFVTKEIDLFVDSELQKRLEDLNEIIKLINERDLKLQDTEGGSVVSK